MDIYVATGLVVAAIVSLFMSKKRKNFLPPYSGHISLALYQKRNSYCSYLLIILKTMSDRRVNGYIFRHCIEHMKVSLVAPKGLLPWQVKDWQREMSSIMRPIVIVSTVSKEGIPNAALKTNFMIVSALERVAFGCHPEHDTHRNVIETGEFVVNVPSEEIIEQAMVTAVDFPHNVNEIEKAGLTAIPSEKVKPPRIDECKLHLECRLRWHKENIILGDVVAASADEDLIQCSTEERQMKLGQMILVGARTYGKIGDIRELPLRVIERYERESDVKRHSP